MSKVRERWTRLRATRGFKDGLLFCVFVVVSALFWFIMTLNDNAQDYFNVKIKVVNKPDSVTFISNVPTKIHVTVNDKGTRLWRHGFLHEPEIDIDFKEYASDGVLRYSYSDFQSALKEAFGGSAQISALSLDSLQLIYTTNPGKEVPVLVKCQLYPTSGSIIEGDVAVNPEKVKIFGAKDVVDTIHYVVTDNMTVRDISENTTFKVKIAQPKGLRTIPDEVVVSVKVEPLVKRSAYITVDAVNVPRGEELLLFPSKVPVEYYVAMSRLSDDEDSNVHLEVNYNEIPYSTNGKLKIQSIRSPERLKNLRLLTDSVEFAVVHE